MSHKKALPDDIDNFFKGESVFFQKPEKIAPVPQVKAQSAKKKSKVISPHSDSTVSSNPATMPPRHRDTTSPSDIEPTPALNPERTTPSMVESIRKAVKQIGKEAATHRFTEEEKRKIADLVYTYDRQGYRTSENEITRVAVNWLLWDYQERGAQSVLARLLEALHE